MYYDNVLMIMRQITNYGIILFLILLMPMGVSAFSVELVDISIDQSGDASVLMQYGLNPVEIGVYHLASAVMDTKGVAKERLEQTFHKTVTVDSLTGEAAHFTVTKFAQIDNGTYISPEFRFSDADNLFNENLMWIKNALSISFIPKMTVVNFFDGYSESFPEQGEVPVIWHKPEN